jgi:hypothetical protein
MTIIILFIVVAAAVMLGGVGAINLTQDPDVQRKRRQLARRNNAGFAKFIFLAVFVMLCLGLLKTAVGAGGDHLMRVGRNDTIACEQQGQLFFPDGETPDCIDLPAGTVVSVERRHQNFWCVEIIGRVYQDHCLWTHGDMLEERTP